MTSSRSGSSVGTRQWRRVSRKGVRRTVLSLLANLWLFNGEALTGDGRGYVQQLWGERMRQDRVLHRRRRDRTVWKQLRRAGDEQRTGLLVVGDAAVRSFY